EGAARDRGNWRSRARRGVVREVRHDAGRSRRRAAHDGERSGGRRSRDLVRRGSEMKARSITLLGVLLASSVVSAQSTTASAPPSPTLDIYVTDTEGGKATLFV